MTNEEKIAVLEESKRQNEIMRDNPTTFWKSSDMEEGVENARKRIEALNGAISALRSVPTGEPLTLEQLREMDGQPVWIVEYPDWGHRELSEDGEDYIADRYPELYGLRHDDPEGRYGLHKLGWLAYAYPPARIDREAWEPCGYCAGAKYVYGHASAVTPNGDKGQIEKELEGDFDYCPECGSPLTPEAWAELEKRLRG